jgi:anti-anti-sigma factor
MSETSGVPGHQNDAKAVEIAEVCWGSALVLALRGRLDFHTSAEAQAKLLSFIDKGYIHLALDLSRLEYISSGGLRILLTTLKKLKNSNGRMVLLGLPDFIRGIFDIAGFTALFPIYASMQEAFDAFRWNHPLDQFVNTPRKGPNAGAYYGETIDIDALHEEVVRAAGDHGWECEHLLNEERCRLVAFSRVSSTATKSVYFSSGIHGDEPAPPLAIANLLWQNQWPPDWNIYICHCLNPQGFRLNQRANAEGIDMNRDYCGSKSREIRAHVAWLESKPAFSMTVSLHEDWESSGFYLYQLGPLSVESVIQHILEQVAEVSPIDESATIDHLPAEDGVLDLAFHSLQVNESLIDQLGDGKPVANVAAAQTAGSIWSEPIYLINRKTRVSYTFESASALPIAVRVEALTRAVNALLDFPHEL